MTHESINTAGLTDKQRLYADFWCPLLNEMNDKHGRRGSTFNKRSYVDVCSGLGEEFGSFGRTMRFTEDGKAQVVLNIDKRKSKDWNEAVFDLLEKDRAQIEGEGGGYDWVWYRLERANVCRIAISRSGEITDSKESLNEIRRWMIEYVVKFPAIFHPYLEKALEKMERR